MPEVNIVAYADKYWDIQNYTDVGRETYLYAGGVFTKFDALTIRYKAFIGFDTLSIPDILAKKIISAKAYIYITNTTSNILRWRYSNADIDEDGHDGSTGTTGSLPDYIELSGGGKWYELNVKTQIERSLEFSPIKKLNLCLHIAEYEQDPLSSDSGVVTISSRESANKPYLVVIYEDLPPNPPTNLSPASETKLNDQVIRFSWAHNPTQTGDTQSKFDLQWSSNGGETWNTISQNTTNQYYDMLANVLPVGNIIWKVKTYSANNFVSEYSQQISFISAGKPAAPVVTKPVSPATVSRPVIEWTASGQVAYEAQVLQGVNTIWGSGETASTSSSVQVVTDLQDNTTYIVRVRIKNQYDLWSDWATLEFTVDFESPNVPNFDITRNYVRGSIRISISNPVPDSAGGFKYNEVLRREQYGIWIKIASNVARDGIYEDCALKSGQVYEYKVRTIGAYGFADSVAKLTGIKLKCPQLASVSDPSLYIDLKYNVKRRINLVKEFASQKFAGRVKPVTEFGEHEDFGIALSATLKDESAYDSLMKLVRSGRTLLYRDHKGRKVYCTVGTLDIEESKKYWNVSFSIAEESHMEEV